MLKIISSFFFALITFVSFVEYLCILMLSIVSYDRFLSIINFLNEYLGQSGIGDDLDL